jgi:hypothetical protein
MKRLLNPLIESKCLELARRLSDYRKKQGLGCHPPQEIWDDAVGLCEHAPLASVAAWVGVSPSGLRIRSKAKQGQVKNVSAPGRPKFLEVSSLKMTQSIPLSATPLRPRLLGAESSRQIELQRSDGSSLRIADLHAHGLDLRAVIEGFIAAARPVQGACR